MRQFALDSATPVPAHAHQAAGSTTAIRYLSRSSWKVITRREYADNQAHAIHTCLVFEDAATNALGGYANGKADAQYALAQATSILSPSSLPAVTFAVDFDPAGHPERTDAYFDGVATVLPRAVTGPYGSYDMVAHAAARGFGLLFGTYAWSAGRTHPAVRQQQYSNGHTIAGIPVDYDWVYPDNRGWFGQWDYRPPPPPDPYNLYPAGPFAWKSRLLPERQLVIEYDQLRAQQTRIRHPHRDRLAVLRPLLRDCADRIYFEAHYEHDPRYAHLPPRWGWNHLGARYQGTIRRANGQRVR